MPSSVKAIAAFLAAAFVSLAITAYGQGVWGVMVAVNLRLTPGVPWAAPVMAALLAVLLLFLGGVLLPGRNAETRRRLLRWNPMPWPVFGWALVGGFLALGALGGLWIAASDLIVIPPGIQPDTQGYSWITLGALLVMSSLAAPLTEEAAFRGYAQGMLEKAWRHAPAAIVGSSLLFAAVHFPQGLALPKLGLYFVAGLIFGTVAYLTNSLLAAMVVHSAGDVLGFTLLWPHDAHPHAMGAQDPLFWPAVVALAVFTPLSLLALRKLAGMTVDLRAAAAPGAWTAAAAPGFA